ncbi:MAG: ABC transporter permease subunit [Kiritimatiellae bacterium]|nr:ABC transporter permease subunit [Kiritimatiellia bacterium]
MTPLTKKRLRSFRRIRRAWWSLIALVGIFVFCLCADWVCPCDPKAVVDAASLDKYRKPGVERVYDIKTARFSLPDGGAITDYEGPSDDAVRALCGQVAARVAAGRDDGKTFDFDKYSVRVTRREGYRRVFLDPKEPAAVTERVLEPAPVAFPFRPVPEHPFGIDAGGRDVYSRVVHGMRIALLFGLVLSLSGMFFGLVIGALEGYFGGVTDIVCQRFTEIWSAMPFLYVMIFIGSTVGRSFTLLLICYAIFNWITVSFYMRAEFLRLRRRTFVEAAKVEGLSTVRILFVHILPNALTPLITLFPFLLMGAISTLAALDFLGFGLPPMTPSCGELLAEAQRYRDAWWLVVFPSLALFIVMLLTVFVGEGLRDAFDPRQASRLE